VTSPLVLLHGFLGRPTSWDRVRAELGDLGAAALAPSLPGHGPDPAPAGERFADAVAVVRAGLPAGRCWLAGYSLGARVALALAVLHPDRIRGAVLVGPQVGFRDEVARATRRRWDEEQAQRIERLGVERFAEEWEGLPLFASQRGLPPELLAEQRRQRREHTAPGLASAMRVLGAGAMPSFWEGLAACPVELRFLAGERDEKFVAIGREAAHLAPRGSFRTVAGAGHNLLLERPEEVAREIRDMISRESR
jgi:2-succinyl-6-hydroxy-2,4-cyclohexadiene-1-carboxylate synthase